MCRCLWARRCQIIKDMPQCNTGQQSQARPDTKTASRMCQSFDSLADKDNTHIMTLPRCSLCSLTNLNLHCTCMAQEPKIEVFDLSALIKKMKKGGKTEFRKVAFYPSRPAVEAAAARIKANPSPASSVSQTKVFPEDKKP